MPRFFYYRERIFMKVRPVESLMRSKTVSGALKKGCFFAVDMHSGALTIVKENADKENYLDPKYMPLEDPDRPGYMVYPKFCCHCGKRHA